MPTIWYPIYPSVHIGISVKDADLVVGENHTPQYLQRFSGSLENPSTGGLIFRKNNKNPPQQNKAVNRFTGGMKNLESGTYNMWCPFSLGLANERILG